MDSIVSQDSGDSPITSSNSTAPSTGKPVAPATSFRRQLSRGSSLTGVQILGVGGFVPETVVRNEDLVHLGCDPDWIIQRTGIQERRKAAPGQSSGDLGAEAARLCLKRAGVDASELDLILVATMTPDHQTPSTACRMLTYLGASCPAMDVGAACAGFMFALVTGMQFVKQSGMQRVLVIGTETMTHTVNPSDSKTYPLFGDGAGAVLLGPGTDEQGLLAYELGSDGAGNCALQIPAGGSREPLTAEGLAAGRQFLQMDGRTVFKWAVTQMTASIKAVAEEAHISLAEVDRIVLHQANARIIAAVAEALGVPLEKMATNVHRYGNTSAASIPLVLEDLAQAGELTSGKTVLLCGFGAGLAWGTGVFRL